jgi:hypothetical protein
MDFDDRDAVQHAASFDSIYIFPDERSYASVGFRIEDENALASIFDYTGYFLNLGYRRTFHFLNSDETQMQVRYQYYLRDYSGFDPFIGEDRRDNRHNISLTGIHPLTDNISLELNYRYIGSNSNLITADFIENIMSFHVRGEFW